MFNVQGKNVVIVGGLNGIGYTLAKTILSKRCNKLYIIDCTENTDRIQQLRTQYQSTKINYQRFDYLSFHAGEIQNCIQDIVMKMQYIDVFVNALEMSVEKDLQRTCDINMKLYLNFMQLVRNVMDRNKGGRGGCIVNVLSNLGLQNLGKYEYENQYYVQQYLINKQMLLSLTKAFSDEIYFQQTGVAVMSVMPVINQRMLTKNFDWIRKIGLQNLVVDMNYVRGQNTYGQDNTFYGQKNYYGEKNHYGHQDYDNEFWGLSTMFNDDDFYNTNKYGYERYGYERLNYDQDCNTYTNQDWFTQDYSDNYLNKDFFYGQRWEGQTGNFYKFLEMLSFNILRVIERGQNGVYTVVGLGGVKAIQQTGNLSRL